MEELPDAQSITAMSIWMSIFAILIFGFMVFGVFCHIKSAFKTGKITIETHRNKYDRKTEPFTFWCLVYFKGLIGLIALTSIVVLLFQLLKGIAERFF